MRRRLLARKISFIVLSIGLLGLVVWFSLPKKIVAKGVEESFLVEGIAISSYVANLYFERFERALGIPLPCKAINNASVEPCLTENIEAILEKIE